MNAENRFQPKSRIKQMLPYVTLAALVITVYAGTLRAQFVYDDHTQLVENVALRSLKNLPLFFTDPAHTSGSMIFEEIYRPLRATLFAVEYQLWGFHPAGFHAVNILFHLLNTILVFLFLRWLLQAQAPAFGAAMLFAVHPALTENVCWVCSSSDLLCMFFFLSGLLAFYRYREESGGKRTGFYALALAGLLLALLSKEMGVTFAAAVLAIDIWRDGLRKQTPRRWLEYAPLWAVTLGYLAFRTTVMSQFAQRGAWGATPLATAGIMARGIKYYVRLLLFPFNLTIIPGLNLSVPLLGPETILSGALVVGLLIFALFFRRRFPVGSLGIVLFFVLLLPVSNIVPIKAVVGDRFIYIPSLGYFIVAGALFRSLEMFRARSQRAGAAVAAGAIVIPVFLFSVNTVVRSIDWRDDFSLYQAAVEVKPAHPRPREMLAKQYFVRGDFEAAREHTLVALRANPLSVDAHTLLGTLFLQEGLLRQAEVEFKVALKLEPNSGDARTNLATIYRKQGRLDEALAELEVARGNSPMVSEILNNIGAVLLDKGDLTAAADYFRKAFEVKPDNWEAACNLAHVMTSQKKYDEAVRVAEASLTYYPNDPELLALLGRAHSRNGNLRAAAETYIRALSQNPSDMKSALALADVYVKARQYEGAADIYRRLSNAHPGTIHLHLSLAAALEAAGKWDDAREELKKAAALAPENAAIKEKLAALSQKAENPARAPLSD
jgi:Flp pilus assembly protein TadD